MAWRRQVFPDRAGLSIEGWRATPRHYPLTLPSSAVTFTPDRTSCLCSARGHLESSRFTKKELKRRIEQALPLRTRGTALWGTLGGALQVWGWSWGGMEVERGTGLLRATWRWR